MNNVCFNIQIPTYSIKIYDVHIRLFVMITKYIYKGMLYNICNALEFVF